MKRNALIGLAAAFLVVIVAWYLVIYSPKTDELSDAQAQLATEQKTTEDLQSQLARLQEEQKNATQQAALLDKFDAAIPELPDLAEFIIQANDIADESGIEFLSIAPAPPTSDGTISTIGLTITISGGFFQVKDYLTKLEDLDRLVIVDSVNLASAGSGDTTTGSTSVSDGISLSVNLTGRMFTRAAPTSADGSVTPPPATPDTSATTAPAAGAATSSSTVPAGSSTTGGT
jgi:Tfp pilus assembly protein PilO